MSLNVEDLTADVATEAVARLLGGNFQGVSVSRVEPGGTSTTLLVTLQDADYGERRFELAVNPA